MIRPALSISTASGHPLPSVYPDCPRPGLLLVLSLKYLPVQRITSTARLGDIHLIIPALDISLPVLSIPQNDQGWDLNWLWQDAGWLEGTAYPTWTGNTVLTGHAYLPSGYPGPFVDLGDLSRGDKIVLIANGYSYSYQVRNKALVTGDDIQHHRSQGPGLADSVHL